jgi:hypothetical protein
VSVLLADGRDSRSLRWDEPLPFGMKEHEAPFPGARRWIGQVGKHGMFVVIASVDAGSLHVSFSHNSRYPTWDEILAVRAWGFPEETEVVMVLARKSEYVNVHQNCFHLWESACGREGR